ncbi:FadR family transcriptional regulator [Bacillus sp. ISL-47]|uniref:FadR/GntR family transcriptional regulator n=1 Tax=Bacillus sp. ISL-47 TaxID=2819130 RepID=UPI001BE9DC99|nr:FadR/GntR family transcriptional regulator [Bacillus sp. ISL-47]MBT2688069.1 FadR family transcriptional regulator [Bacillus sp. ISL-47]MBT2707921.1 FadR family transcriptional regulator [Pseudomonas sp. ISL-84]
MVIPIERKKVSGQVLEQIKQMIKDEKFPPNTKLPSENELAKLFGVSRAPIREALSVLAASGVVESRQGGGSWVREIQLANMLESVTFDMVHTDQVFELLEMRSILETEAAYLAASRHQGEDLLSIEAALRKFKETVENDSKIGHEADYQFHREIVKASKNQFLLQSIENLSELYQKALVFSLKKNLGLQRKREQVYKEHLNIFEAIKNRQPKEAAHFMKVHLTNARIKLGDERVKNLSNNSSI